MKKIITAVLIVSMLCTLCACGERKDKEEGTITKTEHITIDALCVDDDYRDSDNSPLRLVYLFYTLNAGDTNLKIDSSLLTELHIGDNTYSAKYIKSACEYALSYYYGIGEKDVYQETALKVVATFEIPETEFASEKTIKVNDPRLPDADKLRLKTSDIQHCAGKEEVGKVGDPEGYAEYMEKRNEADAERTAQMKQYLDSDGARVFTYNSKIYTIVFDGDNNFIVGVDGIEYQGTYSVRNAFILCTYPSGGSFEIPYEIQDGEIEIEVVNALVSVKHG